MNLVQNAIARNRAASPFTRYPCPAIHVLSRPFHNSTPLNAREAHSRKLEAIYLRPRTKNQHAVLGAWKAVRLCLQGGDLPTAYIIADSVRLSNIPTSTRTSMRDPKEAIIILPSPLSPRLPTHALLHGLIRAGMSQRAHQLSQKMVQTGIPVHTRTMETLVEQMAYSLDGHSKWTEFSRWLKAILPKSDVVRRNPSFPRAPKYNMYAVNIYRLARARRHSQTDRTFRMIMGAGLLQGSLVAGALLLSIFMGLF